MVSGALAAPDDVTVSMRIMNSGGIHGSSWKFVELHDMCEIHDFQGNPSFPVKRTSETPMKPMV